MNYIYQRISVFLGGGSCGATFATVICLKARDGSEIVPKGQILLSPFVAPDCDTPGWFRMGRGGYNQNREYSKKVWKNYQSKEEDALNPYFTPTRAKDLSRLPRSLIIMGTLK